MISTLEAAIKNAGQPTYEVERAEWCLWCGPQEHAEVILASAKAHPGMLTLLWKQNEALKAARFAITNYLGTSHGATLGVIEEALLQFNDWSDNENRE